MLTVLETERLRLRALVPDELGEVCEIFSDPLAMRWSITGVRSREQARQWLDHAIRS